MINNEVTLCDVWIFRRCAASFYDPGRKDLFERIRCFVGRKSVDISGESVPAVESTSCRCPEYTVPLPLFRRSIPELVIEFVRRASEPTISPFNIASFGSRSFDLREYL